jgi:hypothetical protein
MSTRKVIVASLSFALLLLAGAGTPLQADTLTALELSELVQSTVADNDAVLLYLSAGYQLGQSGVPPQTMSFDSTATDASWSGSLSGVYLGETLNLAYANGTNTSDTISWDTSGTFGGGSVTGGGSATISYPTSSTFVLAFSDILEEGGIAYTADFSVPGSILSPGYYGYMFGTSADPEALSTGTYSEDGTALDAVVDTSEYHIDGHWISDITVNGKVKWLDEDGHHWHAPTPISVGYLTSEGTVSLVPEPNDGILFASNLLVVGLVLVMHKRLRAQKG